ncbi:MAG: hypothetical protein R3F31_18420 [Verrucomicrobiales bacterium]
MIAEDDYACVVWHGDAALIVYREDEVLPMPVPSGLPPWEPFFVVAAAQENYSASTPAFACGRQPSAPLVIEKCRAALLSSGNLWAWVWIGSTSCQRTCGPVDLRGACCFRRFFEGAVYDVTKNVNPSHARYIVTEFKQTPYIDVFQQRSPELNGVARLLADLTALNKAFLACPPEHLEERLRTGLDQMPSRQLELPFSQPDETPTSRGARKADLLRALEHEGGELALRPDWCAA